MIKNIREITDLLEKNVNKEDFYGAIDIFLNNADNNIKHNSLEPEIYYLPVSWINYLLKQKNYIMAFNLLNNYEKIFGIEEGYANKYPLSTRIAYHEAFKHPEFLEIIVKNNPDILANNKNNIEDYYYREKNKNQKISCGNIYETLLDFFEESNLMDNITEDNSHYFKKTFYIISRLSSQNKWQSIHSRLWHWNHNLFKEKGLPLLLLLLNTHEYDEDFNKNFKIMVSDNSEMEKRRLSILFNEIGENINQVDNCKLSVILNNIIEKLNFNDYLVVEKILLSFIKKDFNFMQELRSEYEEYGDIAILNNRIFNCDIYNGELNAEDMVRKLIHIINTDKSENEIRDKNAKIILYSYSVKYFAYIDKEKGKPEYIENIQRLLEGYILLINNIHSDSINEYIQNKILEAFSINEILSVEENILKSLIKATDLFTLDGIQLKEKIVLNSLKDSSFQIINSLKIIHKVYIVGKEVEKEILASSITNNKGEKMKISRI